MDQRYGTEVWNGSFKEVWNRGMERRYGTGVVPELVPDLLFWLAPIYIYIYIHHHPLSHHSPPGKLLFGSYNFSAHATEPSANRAAKACPVDSICSTRRCAATLGPASPPNLGSPQQRAWPLLNLAMAQGPWKKTGSENLMKWQKTGYETDETKRIWPQLWAILPGSGTTLQRPFVLRKSSGHARWPSRSHHLWGRYQGE